MENLSNGNRKLDLTVDIVSAFVQNNPTKPEEVSSLVKRVYNDLTELETTKKVKTETTVTQEPQEPEIQNQPVELKPAVPIKKSVTPDYIICLEDGTKLKMLKRHLSKLGMTPKQYREKWNLPADYPMTAPSYAAQRSSIAKKIGLGSKGRGAKEPAKKGKTSAKKKAA